MISFVLVSLVLAALGVLLLLAGLVFLFKRMKLAGAITTLLGVGMIVFPTLTFLYVAIAMQ